MAKKATPEKDAEKAAAASTAAEGATPPADPSDTPSTPPNPAKSAGDLEGTPSQAPPPPPKEPETILDPLLDKQKEIDEELGAAYTELVDRIKATKDASGTDTADQMRAGAVQFLRQSNAVLSEARQLLESCKKVNEANNAQLQSIDKAKKDLERRSEEYRKMTSGGTKNEGQ